MDVSIIVVAWNVRELLRNCLRSVFAETKGITFEIIYVDNGSADGSVEMVRQEFPQVRIIQNEDNKGFIRANNQGIEVATGRYVLLLNSDTIVLQNAIAKTIAFADEHPQAAAVACRVLNPDRTLQDNCFRAYSALNMLLTATFLSSLFPRSPFFNRKIYAGWNYDSVREVDVVVGCFSLVRMKAIKQVGMMDEDYFVYGDDADWCIRFRRAGWKVLFAPVAEIVHYGGQTTRKAGANRFALQLHGSILMYVRKHYGLLSFLFCCVLTSFYLFLRAPYWLSRALVNRPEREKALGSAKTYLAGAYYCLADWRSLLMNREALAGKAITTRTPPAAG
jgi:GT2 family glycosyltransferase